MSLAALAGALWLSGCASVPTSSAVPDLVVPPAWQQAAAAPDAAPSSPPSSPQVAAPTTSAWWRSLGDAGLTAVIEQALARNNNLAQAAVRVRRAQLVAGQAASDGLPEVAVRGNASTSEALSSGARSSRSFGTTASVSWELDLWGRLSGGVDAARASVEASADDLAAMRLSVQASVAQTYFSLRAAEANAQILRETLQAYERSWELTRNRQQAGVASVADVAQAESQYKSTQVQLLEAETTRTQLENALAALLGQAPASFSLPATGTLPQPPVVPAQLPSQLLERRPDIAAAERRVAAANAQIGVAQAAFFPALTLSGTAGYRDSELSNLFNAPNLFWSLGPQLALSLFDGGARTAAVESARAANEQAKAS